MERNNLVKAVLMVSPDSFNYNPQTAQSNSFSSPLKFDNLDKLQAQVKNEFNAMVATLKRQKIKVLCLQSPKNVMVPDAVFPNNWFSLHVNHDHQKVLTLYPMESVNRRLERQVNELLEILKSHDYHVDMIHDLTEHEEQDQFLESTGSMVIDHEAGIIFACRSSRTHSQVLDKLKSNWGYQVVMFDAYDHNQSIYHTNVLMSLGQQRTIICPEVIDEQDKTRVINALEQLDKDIVTVSVEQLRDMCCNVLEVFDKEDNKKLVMSKRAFEAFNDKQLAQLSHDTELVVCDITTLEGVAGGSARCMLAEIR